jgi:hypothetical protein
MTIFGHSHHDCIIPWMTFSTLLSRRPPLSRKNPLAPARRFVLGQIVLQTIEGLVERFDHTAPAGIAAMKQKRKDPRTQTCTLSEFFSGWFAYLRSLLHAT